MGHALATVWLLVGCLVLMACQDAGFGSSADDPLEGMHGFFKNDTGLYYLDLSGKGPVSFVLPTYSATLQPDAKVSIKNRNLVFENGSATFVLRFDNLPTGSGTDRCFNVEDTLLCEALRD